MKLLKAGNSGEKLTPMMQQYVEIKANYKDYILSVSYTHLTLPTKLEV